jgi:molybdenum cofactor synthesis domain-containing protein
MPDENPVACLVVIGNEVLSGRTRDANIHFLAGRLGEIGLPLREVRVIPDVAPTIVGTVNEVRARYDVVFTTGGIGPTHDDITAACIAEAFGVPWEPHPEAFAKMAARYAPGEFNAARQRMATMPRGATLIENPVSFAPGFSIGNVHVMAGVPRIMQGMFEALAPRLPRGRPVVSRAVHATGLLESAVAAGLTEIQARYPTLDLGSYPYERPGANGVAIVAKGTDAALAEAATAEVASLISRIGRTPVMGEPAA